MLRRARRFLTNMVLLPPDDDLADPCFHPDCIHCTDCTEDCPCYIEPDYEGIIADQARDHMVLDEARYEKWIDNL